MDLKTDGGVAVRWMPLKEIMVDLSKCGREEPEMNRRERRLRMDGESLESSGKREV